jgi:hypothetical protein
MSCVTAAGSYFLILSTIVGQHHDDAVLRDLLRGKVAEVKAMEGEKLAAQRGRALDVFAAAQDRLGDAEGARIARDASDRIVGSSRENLTRLRGSRAFDFLGENKPEEAERTYEELAREAIERGQQPGIRARADLSSAVFTGTSLAERLQSAERPDAARRVLVLARKVSEAGESLEVGFFVARGQAKLGDLDAARATLDAIQKKIDKTDDVAARLSILRAMIAARWTAGDKEAARALYDEAAVLARAQPEANSARSNAINLLPGMLATIGDYEGALQMIADEIGGGQKTLMVSLVIDIIGESSGVTHYAQQALRYPTIDAATARKALRLVAKSANDPKHVGTISCLPELVGLQADLGDVEGARASFEILQKNDVRDLAPSSQTWILVRLARAEWNAGNRPAAEADFAEALRTAERVAEDAPQRLGTRTWTSHPKGEAFRVIATTRVEVGDIDGAIEIIARIQDPFQKAYTFVMAGRTRLYDGDRVGALRLAKAPGHGFPSLSLLMEIAEHQKRLGDPAAVEPILRFALKEAEDFAQHSPHDPTIPALSFKKFTTQWDTEPEGREREILQEAAVALELARIRSMLGDIPGARQALDSVPDPEARGDAIRAILVQQLNSGDAQGAFAAASQITDSSRRLSTYYVLGNAIMPLNRPK